MKRVKKLLSVFLALFLVTEIFSVQVYAASKPVIKTQPKNKTAYVDTTAKFTVTATGATSYQWQYRTSSTGTWKAATATGNKTATLSVPATMSRSGYQYRCQVKNSAGTTNSTAATLTVKKTPVFTSQPVSKTLKPGVSAKFTVKATGATAYQWQYRTSSTGTWKNTTATGNKTATLTIPVTVSRNGYQYRCQAKNANGTTNSSAATLNVFAVITEPKSVTATLGTNAEFKVVSGGTKSYQWQYRISSTGTWKAATATGNKTATLTVPATAGRNGYQYRCKLTSNTGDVLYTNAAKLTVDNSLAIKTQPVGLTELMQEDDISLHVEAIGGKAPYSYQWQYRVDYYGTPGEYAEIETDDWYFTDMNTDTLNGKFVLEFEEYGYEFRCAVTDADGKTVYSEPAAFSGKWMILKQSANDINGQVGCLASFGVTVQGGQYPLDYQWQYSNDDTEGFVDVTGKESWHYGYYKNSSLTVDVELEIYTKHYKFRCIITDADGKTLTSDVIELSPEFKINKQPVSVTANLGDKVEFETAAFSSTNHDNAYTGFTPLSYQWQYKTSEMEEFANLTSTMLVEGIQTKKISLSVTDDVPGYKFRCVITNALGEQLITDEVSVITPMMIQTEPTNFKGNIGETAVFTIKAVGGEGPYSYQWMYKLDGETSFMSFPDNTDWADGFKTDKLSIPISLAEFRDHYQYCCAVTDQNNHTVTSEVVCVEPASIYIMKQPKYAEGEPGDTAIFNVEVAGGEAPYTYQWQYTYDTLDDYENFAGGCTWAVGYKGEQLEVDISNDIFANDYRFRCIITDANGVEVISNEVEVVNTAFRIVEQPMDTGAAVGDTVTFTVEVANGTEPYSYIWKAKTTGYEGTITWDTAEGVYTDTLTLREVTVYQMDTYVYYCNIEDANGNELKTVEVKIHPIS